MSSLLSVCVSVYYDFVPHSGEETRQEFVCVLSWKLNVEEPQKFYCGFTSVLSMILLNGIFPSKYTHVTERVNPLLALKMLNFIYLISETALRYKPEGRGFDSRCCHWIFSLT